MNKVFISYRRDDSQDAAGRICDRLSREFGPNAVFMDVDNIPMGADFREHLRTSVMQCDILLAVIGKSWLDSTGADGVRRLDNPSDFVRFEIELALKQKRTLVIPLLLHGTSVPSADKLPGSLKELAYRAAVDIRHTHFQRDLDKLVEHLQGMRATGNAPTIAASHVAAAPAQDGAPAKVKKAPPPRQLRAKISESGAMPTPPARTRQLQGVKGPGDSIFKNRRVLVVAAALAIAAIGYVLYALFNGSSGNVPMIP